MNYLVLLRHGQSQWNLENRFTGMHNVQLTDQGIAEAKAAGDLIKDIKFDIIFSSDLDRARNTAQLALTSAGATNFQKEDGSWNFDFSELLRERDYGDLTGLNKAETAEKFGDEQVRIWRRSYDVPPPGGESLKDVVIRVRPYFDAEIKPAIAAGKNVLIAAHGNSLRAILVALGQYSEEEIPSVEIPTGSPLAFEMSDGQIQKSYYLKDK